MTPSSHDPATRARKSEALVLQRLASIGQVAVAKGLGVNESTVSRMKDGEISRYSQMLAVLGLKVVPVEVRCFDPDEVGALLFHARKRLEGMTNPDELQWD